MTLWWGVCTTWPICSWTGPEDRPTSHLTTPSSSSSTPILMPYLMNGWGDTVQVFCFFCFFLATSSYHNCLNDYTCISFTALVLMWLALTSNISWQVQLCIQTQMPLLVITEATTWYLSGLRLLMLRCLWLPLRILVILMKLHGPV